MFAVATVLSVTPPDILFISKTVSVLSLGPIETMFAVSMFTPAKSEIFTPFLFTTSWLVQTTN